MTTLRSFQDEIEVIHQRETVKQRAQGLAEQEKARDTKKGPVKSPTKTVAGDKLAGDKQTGDKQTNAVEPAAVDIEHDADEPINPEQIQVSTFDGSSTSNLTPCARHYSFPIR